MRIDRDQILSGAQHAQLTTWGNKYNPATPSIKKEGANIVLSTADVQLSINSFDEITLTIIVKFLFMPVWLIKQCYFQGFNTEFDDINEKINNWVKVGLIWKESSVTGEYVRPTYALFSLFGLKPFSYTNIPFNTLTHTISEQKVMFDIMSGNSEIIRKENITIPRVSELGFAPYKAGTNVIAEEDFRYPTLYTDKGFEELKKVENEINKGMKNGEQITPELKNFRYFVIAKKISNTSNTKKDFVFHLPDMAIPLPRKNGQPMSIAIEVELSNKSVNYIESLLRYKNNNKFGVVYWLVNSDKIAQSLKSAYEEIEGTGTCRMMLSEFVVPYPDF